MDAEKVVDKVGVIVEKAASAATSVFDAVSNHVINLSKEYGPQVVDAVLWVIRIDAIQYLFIGFIVVLFFALYIGFLFKCRNSTLFKEFADNTEGMIYIPLVLLFCVGFVTSILYGGRLFDIWRWTAVVKPELYLVKKVVEKVEAKLDASTVKKGN